MANLGPKIPKPVNFDELTAAWDDPVAFAREVAKYNEQLRLAGFAPLYDVIGSRDEFLQWDNQRTAEPAPAEPVNPNLDEVPF